MREGKNVLLDEYYIVHPTPEEISLKTFKYDINSYTLSYVPLTQERYMALFTVKYGVDKWLLTAVYNKYKYGWKVAELELEPYTIDGKTSPELCKQAQAEYDKGYLINAMNLMDLSRKCLMPNSIWRYDELDEMDAFYGKLLTEADTKFPFPIIIRQLPTQPSIFKIFNQDKGDGNYPMIYYISKVSLKNEAAVKAEHEAMKKVIGETMPGINKNNKYVYYTVFNEEPNWKKKKIPYLEIIDEY